MLGEFYDLSDSWLIRYPMTIGVDISWIGSEPDLRADGFLSGTSLKAQRARFNWYLNHLAELRGETPRVVLKVHPQGKRVLPRWGARAREQRTRRGQG